jgi:glycosyltransferase involved in cell wall biosynthesis
VPDAFLYHKAIQWRRDNEGVFLVETGIDFNIFEEKAFPEEYKHIPSPRIIYIGNGYYVDRSLIEYLSANFSSLSFIFIGPNMKLSKKKNLFLLGPMDKNKAGKYLLYADIAIIPFSKDKITYSKIHRPVIFYDYLGAGLPIVAMDVGNFRDSLVPYAEIASDYQEFGELISKYLKMDIARLKKEKREKVEPFSMEITLFKKMDDILHNYQIM